MQKPELLNRFYDSKNSTYLDLFDELSQAVEVSIAQFLHIGKIDGVIFLTIRTGVFIDALRFWLQDPDATTMEPVLAAVATNIKPEIFTFLYILLY